MKFKYRIKQLENISSKVQKERSNLSVYLLVALTTIFNSLVTLGILEYFSNQKNDKYNNLAVQQISQNYTKKISDRILLRLNSVEETVKLRSNHANVQELQVQSWKPLLNKYFSELNLGYPSKIVLIDQNGSIIADNLGKDEKILSYLQPKFGTFTQRNQPQNLNFVFNQQHFWGQAIPWKSQKSDMYWLVVTIPQSELAISSVEEGYLRSQYAYPIYLLSAIALGILNFGWVALLLKKQGESIEDEQLPILEPDLAIESSESQTIPVLEPASAIESPEKRSMPILEPASETESTVAVPSSNKQNDRNLAVKQVQNTEQVVNDQTVNCKPYFILAEMSHELRSPLNAILGFAQIMKQELPTTKASQENIAIINRSGERLLSIINDVVDLAKIETNRFSLEDNNVDFHAWLDNVEQSFKSQANNQGWEFSLIRQQELPQWICIDERRLRQILRNLINHCLTSNLTTEVNLKVSSSSSQPRTVDTSQQNPAIHYQLGFEVENTDIAVTAEELATLFEPMVTVCSEQKASEGSSLNLPISRKLAQLMGGDITATRDTLKESGLIFNLAIQTKSVAAQKLQTQSNLRRIIGLESDEIEYRILIVDDSRTNRAIMKQFLEPVGFTIQEAVNGQEAIDIWLRWQPQMIWMDLRMPIMNGCEATKRIKSYSQTLYTPIVALSASTLEEDKSRFKAAGCDDFVGKPFTESVIFDKIAQHLGIRYVYESITPSIPSNFKLTADTLNVMPDQWLNQLEQAAIILDQNLLTQLLQKIPPEHNSLKNSLQKEVNSFDFDKIINLVRKSKSN